MKRRKLLRHLLSHGCVVLREGKAHTIVVNLENGRQSAVPRHPEVDANLARGICKQLGVPLPTGS